MTSLSQRPPTTKEHLKKMRGVDPPFEPAHKLTQGESRAIDKKISQLRAIVAFARSRGQQDDFPYEPHVEPIARLTPEESRALDVKIRTLQQLEVDDAELRNMIEQTEESAQNLEHKLAQESKIPTTNIKSAVGDLTALDNPETLGEHDLEEIYRVLRGLKFTKSQVLTLQRVADRLPQKPTPSQRQILQRMLDRVVVLEGSVDVTGAPIEQEDEYYNLRHYTLPAIKSFISALLDYEPTLETRQGPTQTELNLQSGRNPLAGVVAGEPQRMGDPNIDAVQNRQPPPPPPQTPQSSVQSRSLPPPPPLMDPSLLSAPLGDAPIVGSPVPPPLPPIATDVQMKSIEALAIPGLKDWLDTNPPAQDAIAQGKSSTESGVLAFLRSKRDSGEIDGAKYREAVDVFKKVSQQNRLRAQRTLSFADEIRAPPKLTFKERKQKPKPVDALDTFAKRVMSRRRALTDDNDDDNAEWEDDRSRSRQTTRDPDDDIDDKVDDTGGGVKRNYAKAKKLIVQADGSFGKLKFNMPKFQKMILHAKKGRKLVASGTMSADLFDLLTKQRLMPKREYSEEALNAYRNLCDLAEIPRTISGQSGKGKLLEGRRKPASTSSVASPKQATQYVYYSNPDELVERLALLVGEIDNGNRSAELVQEASELLDKLRAGGVITQAKYAQILNSIA